MKQLVTALLGIALLTSTALAAGTGPEIRMVDDKVSMQAQAMPLGRLLRLFDLATGMTSKVPVELANRNVSVQFSGLDIDAAVHKIFEGQMLDYVFIGGRGIIVTAASLAAAAAGSGAPPPPFEAQPGFVPEQPFTQEFPGPGGFQPGGAPGIIQSGGPGPATPFNNANPFANNPGNQVQPAMIQTPFGPIPNPRLNQNQPGAVERGVVVPFGGVTPFGQPAAPVNPFGAMNPNAATTTSSPGILPTSIAPTPLAPENQQSTPK